MTYSSSLSSYRARNPLPSQIYHDTDPHYNDYYQRKPYSIFILLNKDLIIIFFDLSSSYRYQISIKLLNSHIPLLHSTFHTNTFNHIIPPPPTHLLPHYFQYRNTEHTTVHHITPTISHISI